MVVIRSGNRKLALVSTDLFASPGGLIADAAKRAGHGFSQRNVLVGATHTHSGPVAVRQLRDAQHARAERADDHRSGELRPVPPARAGRSADLHLPRQADRDRAQARQPRPRPGDRRLGHDPAARRDREPQPRGAPRRSRGHRGGRPGQRGSGPGRIPGHDRSRWSASCASTASSPMARRLRSGAWSTFANHGTVNPSDYQVYTQDHTGIATRTFEAKMRRAGNVPKCQPVIDVFPNSNEGDQSAGLEGQGAADRRARRHQRGQGDVQGVEAGGQAPERAARRSTCSGPACASAARRPPTASSPTRRRPGSRF